MSGYLLLTLISLGICLAICIYHLYRIISLGKPTDYSKAIGNVNSAVIYSYTGAMSPNRKESAYLHLPTYTAGIVYHLGTFLSILLLICFLFGLKFSENFKILFSVVLIISGICGFGILIKRILKSDLLALSNPDDFISNILVTGFQLITAAYLNFSTPAYFVLTSILFLYLPIGKLKHTIYFFAARYHLGFFYGRRGVWPPKS